MAHHCKCRYVVTDIWKAWLGTRHFADMAHTASSSKLRSAVPFHPRNRQQLCSTTLSQSSLLQSSRYQTLPPRLTLMPEPARLLLLLVDAQD